VEGIYKDGLIELAERPAGVDTPTRVIVTFLPSVEDAPVGTGQRVGGQLKGKIWIADDFDELPPDIAEAFGIEQT
jgi:hypothetical protein